MSSVKRRPDGVWRARYRDAAGKEHARHFKRSTDAKAWLAEVTASIVTGTYNDPSKARVTVGEWCDRWLEGYAVNKVSTVRQARTHVAKIKAGLGGHRLQGLRSSDVRSWVASLAADDVAPSYVYALHARLAQIMTDAVHDGLIARSPCSRRTSPKAAGQRAFIATTDQVWKLHDAMPARLRAAVLLGAFAGLRTAEVCGLRVADVDFMRGVIAPAVQYPDQPLKTDESKRPIPIPRELTLELSAHLKAHPSDSTLLTDPFGDQVGPWQITRAVRDARTAADLPDEFRFHDLRHFFASLLISAGADVKVVQARLRHASAKTTLDTYAHLWPDTEEATRAAVAGVLAARMASPADSVRTEPSRG
ncbi:site-specific integrase [Isoptericola rhizosphaerae]|uniref:site-specific integrase n=1 Tax=Isoptericola rhizosphaerae TaxID=3377837 RepID=UPI00383A2C84